jgi:transposase
MVDIAEILTHWQAGRSSREISASLGVSRNTVAKYVAPAERAGIARGGALLSGAEWAERIRGWFPELADTRVRQATGPVIEPHRAYIVEQRRQGVTMATIHQRLRDEHGLACSASSLRRWVAANLPEDEVRREQVAVLRPEPARPGEEAQVDYGKLGRWTDPQTGQQHTIWAFAMVLCASRHLFVHPVIVMDQHAWTAAHVEAFEFFGGIPRRIVPDNLKTGVDKPDLYDPKINKAYGELGAHYRVLIDPARSGKPKDKPQVERPMPYIRDSFWRGRGNTFTSLEQMRAEAVRWCVEVAGQRECRPLDGAAPLAVFEAVEQHRLKPLPGQPFELATWSRGKVGPDIHVKVGQCIYSVPWKHMGETVDARSTHDQVEIYSGGELIKTHVRKPKGKQTDFEDYPPEKIAFFMRTPTWCRSKAAEIGPATTAVIEELLGGEHVLHHLRAAQGVLGLADKHQPDALEAACAKALTAGDPSYRTIKGILAATPAGEAAAPAADSRSFGGDAAAYLRGPDALFGDPAADTPTGADGAAAGTVVALRPRSRAS